MRGAIVGIGVAMLLTVRGSPSVNVVFNKQTLVRYVIIIYPVLETAKIACIVDIIMHNTVYKHTFFSAVIVAAATLYNAASVTIAIMSTNLICVFGVYRNI